MATNTSRIVDLENQMVAVQVKLDTQHQDLKDTIVVLAASRKENIDALTASITRLQEKLSIRSLPHADPGHFTDHQHFRHQQRRPSLLDHYLRLEFSYFSGSEPQSESRIMNDPHVFGTA
ncbi:unnamed protein product [Linum trigynum]|uniref:Uncharacterized protein n=1 Tax=Linum trigynum TaxID=586398 RepID=A0AAV2EE14_9ROSI